MVWHSKFRHCITSVAAAGTLLCPGLAAAQMAGPTPQSGGTPVTADEAAAVEPESWAAHGQSTVTGLMQPAFHSPYQGPQSLNASANARETIDVTLYAGIRPWDGGEFWVNPEVDQGFGLSDTFGVAGYPSGEAYKEGRGSIPISSCSGRFSARPSISAARRRRSIPA